MADYTFTEFPIEADEIDIDQLQQDVQNVTDDILNVNQAIESINQRITALTNRTINGYDLSEDRTLFVQDIPSKNLLVPEIVGSGTVTLTGNSDGSVTVNGTPSETTLYIVGRLPAEYAGKQVIMSGCPEGGSADSYSIRALNGSTQIATDYGAGATFTAANDITVRVRLAGGVFSEQFDILPHDSSCKHRR